MIFLFLTPHLTRSIFFFLAFVRAPHTFKNTNSDIVPDFVSEGNASMFFHKL